ncbi:uncharacterized protein BDZ99DRAFT_565355 [Mytilinidion resinicola]|uniref:Spindle pole body component n=1 Tax=Mytilinidion resinicola TaxID=574789 RepID=A0A6A6Z9D0_9PEZI|nr:uncharacterized protein BDZ99DRAFT_565355 [Mytilinidion resinicola]KAF2817640.1 hypothetical protein BDZ99DRAFT_565355 [Mytilinidion resinicola]
MDAHDHLEDVFTSVNLWKPSTYFEKELTYKSSLFSAIELDIPSLQLENPYAPKGTLDQALHLPDLETFQFGSLSDPSIPDESTTQPDTELQEEKEDIWKIAFDLGPADKDIAFYTWESFENPGSNEPRSAYISEASTDAFDAALQELSQENGGHKGAERVVKPIVLLQSLVSLGLGRSSVLFTFGGEDPNRCIQALEDGRIPGCSLVSSQNFINRFLTNGTTFRQLRSFTEHTYASSNALPARVALANAVSTILTTFETYLGKQSNNIKSMLQLQQVFEKPQEILMHLKSMVDTITTGRTNEEVVSMLYHRIQSSDQGDDGVRQIAAQILSTVARPFLELVGEWTGTHTELVTSFSAEKSFVEIVDGAEDSAVPEFVYNSDMMPDFITDEDGAAIFETGNSLRFLKSHHPEHPLAIPGKFDIIAPILEWKFSWADLELVSEKAKTYEMEVMSAIQELRGAPNASASHLGADTIDHRASDGMLDQNFEQYLLESARTFDALPTQDSNTLPDELQELVLRTISSNSRIESPNDSEFAPPLSLTPYLSFIPILAAQARMINATTLRLFFRSHQLRLHFSLQRQYHLLGDGVFLSRLSSALFSPELEAAERQKGTVRSGIQMGLKLGSRTTWPPASSELRLALMGVLSESFHSSRLYQSSVKQKAKLDYRLKKDREELPGQLNFAIRTLPESEMEKIMDPQSLYALDFLRLQYIPPSPLHLVITSAALEKYDLIFKFLLRLTRMMFVVSHLPRTYTTPASRRFRNEAHHFVSAVSFYIFQTGISDHWTAFEDFLDSVEARLENEDKVGTIGVLVREGLESLKKAHDQCLDRIMFSLLLRRRQKQVLTLLEETFDAILSFSKLNTDNRYITLEKNTKPEMTEAGPEDLYALFKGKVRVFISVCRGLTGKRGYGKGKGTSEENTIDRLLVLLEMSSYYSG